MGPKTRRRKATTDKKTEAPAKKKTKRTTTPSKKKTDDDSTKKSVKEQPQQQNDVKQKISDLYCACVKHGTPRQRQEHIRTCDEEGVLPQLVWPYLVASSTNSQDDDEIWNQACYLLALVISTQCREGSFAGQSSTSSPLEFVEEEQSSVFGHVLQTLLLSRQQDNDDKAAIAAQYEHWAVVVHFITVAWATLQTNHKRLKQELLPYISGMNIWHSMPERRRKLELAHCSADMRQEFDASLQENKQPDPVWIVTLVNQVLNLVENKTEHELFGNLFTSSSGTTSGGVDVDKNEPSLLPDGEGDSMDENGDDDGARDAEEQRDSERQQAESQQKGVPRQVWNFLHRSLELLVDLLSSVETRLHLVPYLDSIHFGVKCRLATTTANTRNEKEQEDVRLIKQLLSRVQRLVAFPIVQEVAATTAALQRGGPMPLAKSDVISLYHARATTLQKLCHRHYADKLPEVVYAGVGLICNGSDYLKRAMGGLSDEQVLDILHRLRLCDKTVLSGKDRDLCMAILLHHVTIPPYPLDELRSFPLYPTEAVLWDHNVIPPSGIVRKTPVLSLPKLNTQFLSFPDYLLRNFELIRLESAYEIRSDLVDAVRRVRPVLRQTATVADDDDDGNGVVDIRADPHAQSFRTEFDGWARMALELPENGVQILRVAPPRLGEDHPAQVIAEVTIDLRHCGDAIRNEWDDIGEFDNLFLVAIDASKATGEPAPLLEEHHFRARRKEQQRENVPERRIPDEEDKNFPMRYGITAVRGCMVLLVRDEAGTILSDPSARYQTTGDEVKAKGTKRILRVELDPAQYAMDARSKNGLLAYDALNLVVRRHGRENNFKAVLETIRGLMEGSGSINRVIPPWLQPLLLGFGDPNSASYKSSTIKSYAMKTAGVTKPDAALDYGDTFLDEEHLRRSFEYSKMVVDGRQSIKKTKDETPGRSNYRVRIISDASSKKTKGKESQLQIVEAKSYPFPPGVSGNPVRFTPVQVEAVRSGLSPGLTVVVGPPGTGKTDVAVQIIANLFHSFPTQRTVIVTHSNAALNDLFEKVMARGDIDERYLIRLGSGQRDLKTSSQHDFTKTGRVAHSLARRADLLEEVQLLSESLGISGKAERGADGSPSYTCETAEYFNRHHIQKRVQIFEKRVKDLQSEQDQPNVASVFPFQVYFEKGMDQENLSIDQAREKLSRLDEIFAELAEYRPLELLRSQRHRTDYLLMKQARIVAMTCTHAAIARSHLIELGFQYDNVVMEEAGQMMEVETFIPLLLQRGESDEAASALSRLKRVCLIGDHHQLPPVVKNMSFSKFSNLDQSLFSRLIRLGVPYIQLNRQGRARADIARLYSWRYNDLGNLKHVLESPKFQVANTGFASNFQIINVEKYQGRGETTPTAYFYQNVGEAEFVVALFQFMVLIGYPPERISILTTYNGQKDLLLDILGQRCGVGTPFAGIRPGSVSTVDQYQGQQNDVVLLSLVRTEAVGHVRDIRRLVVAVSRARLGLYVFCRQERFAYCHELKGTMDQFADRPNKLQLVLGEHYPTERRVGDKVPEDKLFEVEDVSHLGSIVHSMQEQWVSGES